jgi:hypothetical protein
MRPASGAQPVSFIPGAPRVPPRRSCRRGAAAPPLRAVDRWRVDLPQHSCSEGPTKAPGGGEKTSRRTELCGSPRRDQSCQPTCQSGLPYNEPQQPSQADRQTERQTDNEPQQPSQAAKRPPDAHGRAHGTSSAVKRALKRSVCLHANCAQAPSLEQGSYLWLPIATGYPILEQGSKLWLPIATGYPILEQGSYLWLPIATGYPTPKQGSYLRLPIATGYPILDVLRTARQQACRTVLFAANRPPSTRSSEGCD